MDDDWFHHALCCCTQLPHRPTSKRRQYRSVSRIGCSTVNLSDLFVGGVQSSAEYIYLFVASNRLWANTLAFQQNDDIPYPTALWAHTTCSSVLVCTYFCTPIYCTYFYYLQTVSTVLLKKVAPMTCLPEYLCEVYVGIDRQSMSFSRCFKFDN